MQIPKRLAGAIEDFLRLETAGGIMLFAAAVAALAMANSPAARLAVESRLGILCGSTIAGLAG